MQQAAFCWRGVAHPRTARPQPTDCLQCLQNGRIDATLKQGRRETPCPNTQIVTSNSSTTNSFKGVMLRVLVTSTLPPFEYPCWSSDSPYQPYELPASVAGTVVGDTWQAYVGHWATLNPTSAGVGAIPQIHAQHTLQWCGTVERSAVQAPLPRPLHWTDFGTAGRTSDTQCL